ncbi:MAG: redoxin family protein [Isosphaeraceae bacterium]
MSRIESTRKRTRGGTIILGLALALSAGTWVFAAELPAQRGADGDVVSLKAAPGGVVTLIFYSSECPISNSYSPTLQRLSERFASKPVRFVGVCVDFDLTDADVLAHAKDFGLSFPVIRDRQGALGIRLGATISPEAFVIDDQGRVRYHGRIDDQFVARRQANANPVTHELRDAIEAVLEGREVAQAHVPAIGCPTPDPLAAAPTYATDVASILQRNCLDCHRKGQVGPFALETYEQARKRAFDLATVVSERAMPPWKPTPGFGPTLRHDRSLVESEIATIVAWADAGAPLGDPSRIPDPPKFPEDWVLGTPDLVIEPAEDFAIPAGGPDLYRCFVIPTNLPKDVYVSAIEYRPGNRGVVHHMLAYVDTSGKAREKDARDPGPGYECFSGPGIEIHGDLGGWAPGNEPSRLPDGVGRSLPKGSDVVVQVHYHPNGKPETDRSRIGLHFSTKPVKRTLHWSAAVDFELKIPAGESNHTSRAAWEVPVDLEALAVTPHMHLLGRDMTMTVTYPDGRERPLVKIEDWDFAWQNTYYFEKPVDLPKGSVVRLVAHFDNSSSNPRNPNSPPQPVSGGEATTDEMSIGFIAVTKKGQDLTRPGEKDDLREILEPPREGAREREEDAARKRATGARSEADTSPSKR